MKLRVSRWLGLMGAMAALLGAVACVGYAQPASGGKPRVEDPKRLGEPKKKEKKDDEVRIDNADQGRYDANRDLFYLSGNVVFRDEDVKLYCDEASYNGNDDTAACAGNLRIVDPENTITGLKMNADFDAEIANIEGNVKIVTTKTPKSQENRDREEGKEPKKRITTITCDKVVYYYTEGERRAIATGNVKAVQEDKTVTAQRADYDREKDVVVLGTKVTFTMENGNTFVCRKATISVTDDWINVEGMDNGVFKREKKEADEGSESTPAAGAPGTEAPPAGEQPPPNGGEKPGSATLKPEERTEE